MLKFTLGVSPRTKKNSQSFVTLKNGRTLLLPSKPYKEFEKQVIQHVEALFGNLEPIDEPINLKCIFYKDAKRKSDLVGYEQAICDALVKAGLIADDNHEIVASMDGSRVFYDKNYPRIEIEITKHEDLPF